MADASLTRRTLFGAMALAPVVIAAPAIALSGDPVDEYWAAFHAHNADRLDEEGYMAALDRMDEWEPRTHRDFVRKFLATFEDGGMPTQERMDSMIASAKRLAV